MTDDYEFIETINGRQLPGNICDAMESNEILRLQILEIVDNQIKSGIPILTNQTLKRLIGLGYSDEDARMLIAQCVAVELFGVLKFGKPFDEKRYASNLKKLPEEPFDS